MNVVSFSNNQLPIIYQPWHSNLIVSLTLFNPRKTRDFCINTL